MDLQWCYWLVNRLGSRDNFMNSGELYKIYKNCEKSQALKYLESIHFANEIISNFISLMRTNNIIFNEDPMPCRTQGYNEYYDEIYCGCVLPIYRVHAARLFSSVKSSNNFLFNIWKNNIFNNLNNHIYMAKQKHILPDIDNVDIGQIIYDKGFSWFSMTRECGNLIKHIGNTKSLYAESNNSSNLCNPLYSLYFLIDQDVPQQNLCINVGLDLCAKKYFKPNSANMVVSNVVLDPNDDAKEAAVKIGYKLGFINGGE